MKDFGDQAQWLESKIVSNRLSLLHVQKRKFGKGKPTESVEVIKNDIKWAKMKTMRNKLSTFLALKMIKDYHDSFFTSPAFMVRKKKYI